MDEDDEDEEDEEEDDDEDDDVDQLPEFANDEAKALHQENKKLKELQEKLDADTNETKHR